MDFQAQESAQGQTDMIALRLGRPMLGPFCFAQIELRQNRPEIN